MARCYRFIASAMHMPLLYRRHADAFSVVVVPESGVCLTVSSGMCGGLSPPQILATVEGFKNVFINVGQPKPCLKSDLTPSEIN